MNWKKLLRIIGIIGWIYFLFPFLLHMVTLGYSTWDWYFFDILEAKDSVYLILGIVISTITYMLGLENKEVNDYESIINQTTMGGSDADGQKIDRD